MACLRNDTQVIALKSYLQDLGVVKSERAEDFENKQPKKRPLPLCSHLSQKKVPDWSETSQERSEIKKIKQIFSLSISLTNSWRVAFLTNYTQMIALTYSTF